MADTLTAEERAAAFAEDWIGELIDRVDRDEITAAIATAIREAEDAAFRAGAEAMREAAGVRLDQNAAAHRREAAGFARRTPHAEMHTDAATAAEGFAMIIRSLPIPTRGGKVGV